MRVLHKCFRAFLKSWKDLFKEAADFATEVGRERLISISHHSADQGMDRIVTVWYWDRPEVCPKCGYSLTGNESGRCPECGTTA